MQPVTSTQVEIFVEKSWTSRSQDLKILPDREQIKSGATRSVKSRSSSLIQDIQPTINAGPIVESFQQPFRRKN